ncbi:hypothetical protein KP509_06G073200 [Ceratopteris richardii]|uniref:Chromo domain-containing protein n=1 Tax=Ceratopteris richardii TaxID=49495 RepID=A0A8T2UJM9_CERRI|nr:hypothetical protein KP509_06G073200 [Ceratopteris richardii]
MCPKKKKKISAATVVERQQSSLSTPSSPSDFDLLTTDPPSKDKQPILNITVTKKEKPELSPRFCGPWTIIKKISDVSYKLQLPENCKVHPVFHVSKLRPYISRDENCVDGLVALENRSSQPYVPFQVLDKREKKIRNRSIPEYLVAWTSHPFTNATWESEALIRKHFPSLITKDSDL